MTEDDCNCEADTTKAKFKHKKCRVFKLMDDQMDRTDIFIRRGNKYSLWRYTRKYSWCLYSILGFIAFCTTLFTGIFLGAGWCGKDLTTQNSEGVF